MYSGYIQSDFVLQNSRCWQDILTLLHLLKNYILTQYYAKWASLLSNILHFFVFLSLGPDFNFFSFCNNFKYIIIKLQRKTKVAPSLLKEYGDRLSIYTNLTIWRDDVPSLFKLRNKTLSALYWRLLGRDSYGNEEISEAQHIVVP